jgi:hypothetical protein
MTLNRPTHWPPGTQTYLCYLYARDIVRGRTPENEAIIAKNAWVSYYYARDVIKGRFELGEDAIAKVPEVSFKYLMAGF